MADHAHSPLAGWGLPLNSDFGERRRFSGIMVVMLALFLPPAFLVPMLEVPEIERSEAEKVPPRLARPPPPKPVPSTPLTVATNREV